ncbi:MAG TPA: hypothetical protein VKD72_33410 [Gemmataceae bacterium]|nr:hypothetical protein [Gemmataceae bacterium]
MSPLEWVDKARDQLADIWVAATPAERAVMGPLVVQLESDLRDDPLAVGESSSSSRRVVIRSPLVVWFNVWPGRVRIFYVTRPRQP